MGLQDRLDTIREGSKTRVPPETRAVMQRNIEELRASGIMDRVARVGQPVSLAALRAPGPLVLSFYRGRW